MINGIKLSAKEVCKITNGILIGEDNITENLTIDSREKSDKMSLFFAIKGKNFNGNFFINEAIENGARIIVSEEEINAPVSVIKVKNTKKALGLVAKNNIRRTKVIGVSGSVGKTTTKDMVTSVLKEKYNVKSTYLNQNNDIGVPLTLLALKNEDFCVVEMGMRGLGEIDWLAYISQPYISIITNCGSAHIELLGNEENIFKAKTEILNYSPKYALVPNEDRFRGFCYKNTTPVFVGKNGDYEVVDVSYSMDGINFLIKTKNKIIKDIVIKTPSIYDCKNAIYAYAIGNIVGLTDKQIKNGLYNYTNNEMRGATIKLNDITIINDSYNASFEGMKNSIISLSQYSKFHNKIPCALIGDMLELGEKSNEYHQMIGEFCKKNNIEKLFAYGCYADYIARGFGNATVIEDRKSIAKDIREGLPSNSVLLVKASRALHFEDIIKELKEN
ncbi:MAG: UDP-N-acetylmuramoyl-tripeptide--D-alanyl-D-alanine ligase [Clostridia bacterium]|nr:UDP-N-acetylmuramoyl-tripeptide--D-alanyl-D-alanine ligase [Clostridia bacterium]MBQ7788086.1 UDP-N-acetylmuramoyl-tripeptide--D-alanyl-D-alanine ligase [Clostridia bacterium]